MFARIFALGLCRGPSAYLRDNYNRLDFLVIVASWALKIVAWDGIYQPIYPGAPVACDACTTLLFSVQQQIWC